MKVVPGSLPLSVSGRFKPWAISVGHSKLLMRGLTGDPEGDQPPRVFDLLFQDVSRICLSDAYPELHLRAAPEARLIAEAERLGVRWPEATMYLVDRTRDTDYVVAGRVYWAEVAVPPGAGSPLLSEDPDGLEIPGVLYFA
ncbi:hypothetical protein ABTX15_01640 [Micromonospora sp. NPDC094482]|uniref:hypothetical protein n=1 Tax=unclassified Micromonospora TaxID=2617518 RepID=UPI0033202A08